MLLPCMLTTGAANLQIAEDALPYECSSDLGPTRNCHSAVAQLITMMERVKATALKITNDYDGSREEIE